MANNTVYRAAIALAVGTALFILWGMAAVGIVGIEGDTADLMYFGVLAAGISGAIVARFQPKGMARAMFVTAGAVIVVGVVALRLGKHQAEYSSVFEILGLSAMFAALFAGSGIMFGMASGSSGLRNRADPHSER